MIGIDLSKLAGVYYNDVLVDALVMGNNMVWESKPSEPIQINEPLHFYVNPGDATVELGFQNDSYVYLEYSGNKTDWKEWNGETLTVDEAGIYIRGNNPGGFSRSYIHSKFVCDSLSPVQCEGNIMSLLGEAITEIPCDYCFQSLFMGVPIQTAPVLPAKVLTEGCYQFMFERTYLHRIEIHATDISAPDCLGSWLADVGSNGTFVCDCSVEYPLGVSGIPDGWTVECLKVEEPGGEDEKPDLNEYFWFETTEETTLKIVLDDNAYDLEYNGGDIEIAHVKNGDDIPEFFMPLSNGSHDIDLHPGYRLFVKGHMTSFGCSEGSLHFSSEDTTPCVSVYGNVHCLVLGPTDTTIEYKYARLFRYMTNLVDAQNLILPDMSISGKNYYLYMFDGCSNLVYPPELPAREISDACYQSMFRNCTSLIKAPELPAPTVKQYCYAQMFQNCTSLTTNFIDDGLIYDNPIILPASNFATYCYYQMFQGCTSIEHVNIVGPLDVSNTQSNSCSYMFDGCTSLRHITALFIPSISFYVNRYQNNWVRNVAPNGTFVCNKGRKGSWGTGNNYAPTGWTIVEL